MKRKNIEEKFQLLKNNHFCKIFYAYTEIDLKNAHIYSKNNYSRKRARAYIYSFMYMYMIVHRHAYSINLLERVNYMYRQINESKKIFKSYV